MPSKIYNAWCRPPEKASLSVPVNDTVFKYACGFIALSKSGDYAGYSLKKGFNYALTDKENDSVLIDADYKV